MRGAQEDTGTFAPFVTDSTIRRAETVALRLQLPALRSALDCFPGPAWIFRKKSQYSFPEARSSSAPAVFLQALSRFIWEQTLKYAHAGTCKRHMRMDTYTHTRAHTDFLYAFFQVYPSGHQTERLYSIFWAGRESIY